MEKITLSIDMMGGDLGSAATLEGVKLFLKKHCNDAELILVGKQEELIDAPCRVVDARDVLPMEAGPLEALRAKESSMLKAIKLVKDGEAVGVVSTGSTGAYLSGAAITLKKIPGVERPALVTPFPTVIKGKKVVILDVGASNENSSQEIYQFAIMGDLYSKVVLGVKDPKVCVLANGTEEGKGSPEGKGACELIAANKSLNFGGNIEAREVLSGQADVIVTDGFSGNVLLKSTEGTAKVMKDFIKSSFKRNIFSKIGYLLSKKGFDEMGETMDYKTTGGALLIGVNGVVVKAHGNSDGIAFFHAIEVAYNLAKANIVKQIEEGLAHE